MPDFTVEFEVYCGTCGAGLCQQSTTGKTPRRNENTVNVEVCTHCIDAAKAPLEDRIEVLEQLLKEARERIP